MAIPRKRDPDGALDSGKVAHNHWPRGGPAASGSLHITTSPRPGRDAAVWPDLRQCEFADLRFKILTVTRLRHAAKHFEDAALGRLFEKPKTAALPAEPRPKTFHNIGVHNRGVTDKASR
jgi:hypothetical protein